jgi:hypothetical protein
MTLRMGMPLGLLGDPALESRIRQALRRQGKTFPPQPGKARQNPPARGLFQCFVGLQVLIIRPPQEMVLNLKAPHRVIRTLLGDQ